MRRNVLRATISNSHAFSFPSPLWGGWRATLVASRVGDARRPHPAARFRSQLPSPRGGGITEFAARSRLSPIHNFNSHAAAARVCSGDGCACLLCLLPRIIRGSGAPRRRIQCFRACEARHAPCDRCVSPLGAPRRRFWPSGLLDDAGQGPKPRHDPAGFTPAFVRGDLPNAGPRSRTRQLPLGSRRLVCETIRRTPPLLRHLDAS